MSIYLTGVPFTSVYLICTYLTDIHLIGIHLMDIYLMDGYLTSIRLTSVSHISHGWSQAWCRISHFALNGNFGGFSLGPFAHRHLCSLNPLNL
jgi:hypothetical protein